MLQSSSDHATYLASALVLLKAGGFLLVIERTRQNIITDFLKTISPEKTNKVLTHDYLLNLFAEINVDVVAYQTDPLLVDTMYVYR